MEDIYQKADALVMAIRESNEYKDYHKYLALIKQNEELYNHVNEFRKRHFAIQNNESVRMGYAEYEELAELSRELRKNDLVSAFLDAEIGLGRLVQEVHQKLMTGIEFDGDFLG